jgi:hypothetical protein
MSAHRLGWREVVGVEHRIVRITALFKNVIGQRTPVLDAYIAARLRGFRLLNVIRIPRHRARDHIRRNNNDRERHGSHQPRKISNAF